MRIHRAALAIIPVLGLLIASAAPRAQAPPAAQNPQVFRGNITLVPVDIRVVDRTGAPVTDLAQADFTVFENGVPQTIRHFSTQSYVATTPGAASHPAVTTAAAASARPAPDGDGIVLQNRRIFLLVLARGRLQNVGKGVDGLLHFVGERMLPQDLVAVMAWNRATDFTTDRARVLEVLERFKRAHEGIEAKLSQRFTGLAAIYGSRDIPPSLQGEIDAVFGGARDRKTVMAGVSPNADRLNDDTRKVTDALLEPSTAGADAPVAADPLGTDLDDFVASSAQTMQDLGNLYAGVEYLRRYEGEKHLVFVSALGLALPRAEDDKDLAFAASNARVVIDYIHTSGTTLARPQMMFSAENARAPQTQPINARGRLGGPPVQPEMWKFATARTLAEQTGGSFYANRFRNAAGDLDHIDDATRFEYILGYYPANPAMDGRFRRITVRVNRPGVTVLYRHGYFARPPAGPTNAGAMVAYTRIAAAANYAKDVPDIGVQGTASVPKTPETPLSVQLDLRVDPSRVTFTARGGRSTSSIELATFLVDGADRLVAQTWKTVELTYTDERLQEVKRDGVPIRLSITVNAPPKNVKVVVYDPLADLVGSVVIPVRRTDHP